MKRPPPILIACLVVSAAVSPTAAWWSDGHAHVTDAAVGHLPQPLRGFFHAHRDTVATASGEEPPAQHYINIDLYPEFFAGTFPREINVLVATYGSTVVQQRGMGPWTAADYLATVSAEMAAAGTTQAWSDLLADSAALAHYLADLHNPLHLTENYNGQRTGNNGIHARYEGEMIGRHLPDLTLVRNPAGCTHWAWPIDAILDGVEADYAFVDDIMAADTANRGVPPKYNEAYYTGMWEDTGAFTHPLFQSASESVAAAWYTAWVDAGSPRPRYALDLDDYDRFQGCIDGPGVTPIPQSPATIRDCLDGFDLDDDGDVDMLDFSLFQSLVPAS
jgi:hypothetical protein